MLGAAVAGSALLAQAIVAGPGLMAPCHDLPVGAPRQRCSLTDASHPYEGTVAIAFVVQHAVLALGLALGTWGASTLRSRPTVWGIALTYVGLIPTPVDAALRGWSSAAAQDLGDFSAIWGYLAVGPWAWALRGRWGDRSRAVLIGLLSFLFVGGAGAFWVALTDHRDVGWNLFAFAFAAVQLAAGAWLVGALMARPWEALARPKPSEPAAAATR